MRSTIVAQSGRRSSDPRGKASKPPRLLRRYESRLERFCRLLADDAELAAEADLDELEQHFRHALRDAHS